jgi:precorrin-2 methylase
MDHPINSIALKIKEAYKTKKSHKKATKSDLEAEIKAYKKLHKKIWKELESERNGAYSCCEVAEMMSEFEEKFPL